MEQVLSIAGNVGGLIVGVVIAFAIFTLVKIVLSLRRVVPTNMVHIVQSKKETISYGKGRDAGNVYYEWPTWIPVIGVTVSKFPESVFDVSLENYDAYDTGRLPFVVDVKAFFRISDSNMAAQRVYTFDELQQQLAAILQGAVRRVLATDKLENIMEDRAGLGARFTQEVDAQLTEWGVKTVKSIEFMDLRDSRGSTVIENIMAKEKSRIEMESRMKVAENHQHAETKEIEAKRQVELQRQEAEQQVGMRTAEKVQKVGIADQEAQQNILASSKITAEKDMEVQRVQTVKAAEITKDAAIVAAEQQQREREIKANADKNVLITTAEGDKTSTVTKAEGQLAAAQLNAKGIEAEGLAKGTAEQAILMAPVNTQITLAKEIGENQGYQTYLIQIKQIEASKEVGMEMATAFSAADMKIIANSGSIGGGMKNLTEMVSSAGGTNIAGLLESLNQSDLGANLLSSLANRLNPAASGKEPSIKRPPGASKAKETV